MIAELHPNGFADWHDFADWNVWRDDPDANPAEWIELPDVGWIRTAEISITSRKRAVRPLPAVASAAPKLLTLREASAITRTPSETIRFWIWQGRLTSYKPGRAVLVREDELLALLESRNPSKTRRNIAPPTRRTERVLGEKK